MVKGAAKETDFGFKQSQIILHYRGIGIGYGRLSHWWGPGFHSSISLSTNAPSQETYTIGTFNDLQFGKFAFGSRKDYWKGGSKDWEKRMDEVFNSLAKNGSIPWIHMMRGLSLGGKRWPFASADSANVARNYSQREVTAEYMARQIDSSQCPVVWKLKHTQQELMK